MRILIISTHDSRGGAGKAAYRFSKEFINQGHEVCLYVRDKKEKDDFIVESSSPKFLSKLYHLLDFLPGYILSGFNKDANFTLGLFGERLDKIIEEFKPDIINVHWTWKGFISFGEICKVSRKIPVVWTMHDYSPFSGGVFYFLNSQPVPIKLLSYVNSLIRGLFLSGSNLIFVSPSKFLCKEFETGKLSSKFDCKVINNGIDTSVYKKLNKQESRKQLNLESNKKYILFGAVNILENKVKGGKILKAVLSKLENYLIDENIGLLSFGSSNPFPYLELSEKIEKKFIGYVHTDQEMAELFASADVMLVPSMHENYPFVVMESLSCSVPVVAFKIGGIPEMIEQKKSGYIVEPYSIDNYVKGIMYRLGNHISMEHSFSFSIRDKAKKYINLFREVLSD